MLDKYPVRLPIKASFTYASWKLVLITSQYHPNDTDHPWYPNVDYRLKPHLARRITNVFKFPDEKMMAYLVLNNKKKELIDKKLGKSVELEVIEEEKEEEEDDVIILDSPPGVDQILEEYPDKVTNKD